MTGGCHFCDKQGFGLYFINRIPTRDETGDCLNSDESGSGIASFFSGVLKLGRLIRGNCLSESYPVKSPSGNHQFPNEHIPGQERVYPRCTVTEGDVPSKLTLSNILFVTDTHEG